jgi:hypothetical protein
VLTKKKKDILKNVLTLGGREPLKSNRNAKSKGMTKTPNFGQT